MPRVLSPSMLAWLRAFDAAARHLSFTRAAEELRVTQGAVSQQVKHLERALRFPLLRRSAQALELTPEGQQLAAVLETSFAAIRDALAEIAAPGGAIPITLSCSPTFAIRWLTPRLSGLLARHPNVDLRVFGEFHRLDRARMTMEGLEAAIRYDAGDYPDLVATPFLDEYLVPVASPAFLARHPELTAGASHLDGRWLLHDARPWSGGEDDQEWLAYLRAVHAPVAHLPQGRRFNLSQLAVGAALAGEGIAMGRLALVLDELETGRLVPLFGSAVPSPAAYHFVATAARSPRALAILAWLQVEAAGFVPRRAAFLSSLAAVG